MGEQAALGLDAPGETIQLTLPWPPSVNHYFMEYAMPPATKRIEEYLAEHGTDGIHVWLRKNTRTMKRVGEKGHEYRAKVQEIVLVERKNKGLKHPVLMRMRAFPPDRRERDLSNLYKCLEDALQQAGVILSDYQIAKHDSERRDLEIVKGGRIEITLEPHVYS